MEKQDQSKRKQGRRNVSFVVPYSPTACRERMREHIQGTTIVGSKGKLVVPFTEKNQKHPARFFVENDADYPRQRDVYISGTLERVDKHSTRISFSLTPDYLMSCLSFPSILYLVFAFFLMEGSFWITSLMMLILVVVVAGLIGFWKRRLKIGHELKKRILIAFDLEPGVTEPQTNSRLALWSKLSMAVLIPTLMLFRFWYGTLSLTITGLIAITMCILLLTTLIRRYRAF
jgi:hypothetical protein